MPWVGGNFTRVHDWGADAGAAIDIEASRMDAEDNNFRAGIEACLNKAGQNAMTGDLDLGGNNIANALSLEIQDAGATDSMTATHDGTDVNLAFVNTTDINFRDGVGLTIWDSTDTDNARFSHDGTDFNTVFTNTTGWNVSGGDVHLLGGKDLYLRGDGASDAGVLRLYAGNNTDAASLFVTGNNLDIFEIAGTVNTVRLRSGLDLQWLDSTDADSATFSHDGTDFSSTFTNTTDWNISGLTAIQAGTVDADFDAVTATSYGGITEANLVDKTATETISGTWTIGGVSSGNLLDKTASETVSGVYNFTAQPTISGDDIPAKTEGSFTLNWTGFTTAESTTVYYTKVDDLVTLWFVGSASGTSNLGTLTSGFEIPVAIQPPRSASHIIEVQNNGTWENGRITLQSTGTVSILRNGGSAFTTSGTKSFLNDMNFSYTINPNIV